MYYRCFLRWSQEEDGNLWTDVTWGSAESRRRPSFFISTLKAPSMHMQFFWCRKNTKFARSCRSSCSFEGSTQSHIVVPKADNPWKSCWNRSLCCWTGLGSWPACIWELRYTRRNSFLYKSVTSLKLDGGRPSQIRWDSPWEWVGFGGNAISFDCSRQAGLWKLLKPPFLCSITNTYSIKPMTNPSKRGIDVSPLPHSTAGHESKSDWYKPLVEFADKDEASMRPHQTSFLFVTSQIS